MGAVYRKVEPRKQKGRYIYNRDRLHKAGWQPKHNNKYRALALAFKNQLEEYYTTIRYGGHPSIYQE